jgi:sortase A
MSTIRRLARRASVVFLAAGCLVLGYAGYVVIDARIYQARELARLRIARQDVTDAVPSATEAAVPVVGLSPPDGEALGQIEIKRLGLSVLVAQGESESILQHAVGHLPRTALPGFEGNVVLAGHRDTFFRPLKDIRNGDRITIATARRDFVYVVESTSVVKPTDVYVLRATGGHTLTLITCFPFYYVGSAPNRFIVFARELDDCADAGVRDGDAWRGCDADDGRARRSENVTR